MTPVLEFRRVGFAYAERPLFAELNAAVRPGEMVALLGPNGAGKTTLLKLATALLRPSAGDVLLQQKNLRQWRRRSLSRSVALVPQHLEVPFAFRVEELVAQGRVPHQNFFGSTTAADREAIEGALDATGLAPLRHRVFASLSGGERQRVKIAIALAQQPRLMLLDEPTQHLDLGRQLEAMALLHSLAEGGIAILAAMHDLVLIREHFSAGILLTPEAEALAGPVEELLRPDLLERAFSVERATLDRYLAARGAELPGATLPEPA